jgi:hypothetical protein
MQVCHTLSPAAANSSHIPVDTADRSNLQSLKLAGEHYSI